MPQGATPQSAAAQEVRVPAAAAPAPFATRKPASGAPNAPQDAACLPPTRFPRILQPAMEPLPSLVPPQCAGQQGARTLRIRTAVLPARSLVTLLQCCKWFICHALEAGQEEPGRDRHLVYVHVTQALPFAVRGQDSPALQQCAQAMARCLEQVRAGMRVAAGAWTWARHAASTVASPAPLRGPCLAPTPARAPHCARP